MYDLTAFTLRDMAACGAALRTLGADATSMEQVADRIVHYLYDHLVDGDGRRATCLVRFFITRRYDTLNADLRRHVDRFLDRSQADPALKCQTLLATVGENPDWHSRHNSRFYKVHPLSREIVDVNPMFAQVSEMFGIALDEEVQRDPGLIIDLEQKTYNIFHVPDALGTHYIPDQADFVIPYGIRSVLGFFGMLPSGHLFTVIVFAKVLIARDFTDYFRPLALNVKMAILPFDDVAVFADEPPPAGATPAQAVAQFRSQAAGLTQLLQVHERVVQAQSERIAEMASAATIAEERNRLARDLHDSVMQAIYSQMLYAEAAERQLNADNGARAADHLRQLKASARQALREMRLLIFELRPPALEEAGLLAALHARLEAVEARTGVQTTVMAPEAIDLPADVETGLYWIAQEALTNALKHANADQITIRLATGPTDVQLAIADNGIGIAGDADAQRGKLGLRSMRERAAKLGGRLTIDSAPDRGTTIAIEVPYV